MYIRIVKMLRKICKLLEVHSVSEMSFDLVQFQAIEYEMYADSHQYRGVEDLQCLHLIPVMKLIVSQVVTWQSERGNKRS